MTGIYLKGKKNCKENSELCPVGINIRYPAYFMEKN